MKNNSTKFWMVTYNIYNSERWKWFIAEDAYNVTKGEKRDVEVNGRNQVQGVVRGGESAE